MILGMAREIAADLKAEKVVCVIVATRRSAVAYLNAINRMGATGKILFLCAEERNGPAYRGHRFDAVHVDLDGASKKAMLYGQELAQEAAARTNKPAPRLASPSHDPPGTPPGPARR